MKYNVFYRNSAGVTLNLCDMPYLIETGDIFDFVWGFTASTNHKSYGGRIDAFTKAISSRNLRLSVIAFDESLYKDAIDALVDCIEYDVINKTPGRLYVNGNYLKCYVTEGRFEDWEYDINYLSAELTITSEYPMWIIERECNFLPNGNLASGAKRYPNKYPYRYASGSADGFVFQGSNSPANFKIVFHGPALSPQIIIDGNVYGIVGADLEENEYVILDSFEGTIIKYDSAGNAKSLFNNRTRENDCFAKLKTGTLNVQWSGEYQVAITIYEERSMPKWNLSQ